MLHPGPVHVLVDEHPVSYTHLDVYKRQVYGMPMVAYDIGAVAVQASCENIAGVLMAHLKGDK